MKKGFAVLVFVVLFGVIVFAESAFAVGSKGWVVSPTNKKLMARIGSVSVGSGEKQAYVSFDGGHSDFVVTYSDRHLPVVQVEKKKYDDVQAYSVSWSKDGKYLLVELRRYRAKTGNPEDNSDEETITPYFSVYDSIKNDTLIVVGEDPKWVAGKNSIEFVSLPSRANGYSSKKEIIPANKISSYCHLMNTLGDKGRYYPVFTKFINSLYIALMKKDIVKINGLLKVFPDDKRGELSEFVDKHFIHNSKPAKCGVYIDNKDYGSIMCDPGTPDVINISFGYEYLDTSPSKISISFYASVGSQER